MLHISKQLDNTAGIICFQNINAIYHKFQVQIFPFTALFI